MAVVCGNKLYVANVGDSRAVVIYQTPNGTLETLQLSTDHDVKNEDELKRFEQLHAGTGPRGRCFSVRMVINN